MSAAKRSSSIRWSNAEAENTTRAIRGSLTQSRTSRSSRVSRTSTLKRSKSVRSFWNSGREGGQEPHRADSGTDVEQGPAQHELAAAQAQVTQLSRQLEAESRHANMLDGELGLSLAQLRRQVLDRGRIRDAARIQEEAHGIEQSRLEEKNIQGVEQRRSLMEKLKQIETVENAVRELYIQMKDRVAEEAPSAEQLQLELVALGKEDVLVTIGKLHAELKNLWVFKTEAEEDMRVGRLQEQQLNTRNTRVLQQQLLRLGKEVTAAHDAADKAQQRAAEAEESRQAVLDESKDVVADLQTHMQAVVEQLRAAESENASLRRKLTQARDEGRKRDSLVLQNRQLENARHFDRESLNNMLRAQRHDMLRQQSQLLAEISSIPVLQKQIDELQEELRAAKNLIRSLQGSFKASQVLKMERRTAVLEGQNERLCRAKGELQRKVAQQAEAEAALASGKKVLEGQLRSLQQQVEGGRPRSAPGGGRKTQQYRSARSEANGESAGGGSNSARKVRDPSAAGQAGKVLATTDPLLERVRTSLANVRGRLADASLIRATHDARRYEREA